MMSGQDSLSSLDVCRKEVLKAYRFFRNIRRGQKHFDEIEGKSAIILLCGLIVY